jgi:CubicO group peptidase (beta-lactamase class C family)
MAVSLDVQARPTLAGIQNITIDEAAARQHVISPPHVVGVISSKGLEEGAVLASPKLPPAISYHLDVGGFGQAVHAAIKDIVAGYCLELRQNGATIYTLEWNWAQYPQDGGEGWNPGRQMHIASCSKLMTAIAMTKLLNEKHIPYDTPIIKYLPSYWAKGPNINLITFANLMTHTSGFNSGTSSSDYAFMKGEVAAGVTDHGQYHYQNMNFGLCRILVSVINGNISVGQTWPGSENDAFWYYVTIQAYSNYVHANVFAPSGVTGPTLTHPGPDALAYNFPVSGNGWNSGDLSSVSGGAGWHMSVDEMLNVMGTFRRKGTIMSTAQAQTLLDDMFGIDVRMATPLGTLYNKNGLWGDGSGQVEQSLAYFLPENMELVLLTNSPVGSPAQFFRDKITNIYVANIKP